MGEVINFTIKMSLNDLVKLIEENVSEDGIFWLVDKLVRDFDEHNLDQLEKLVSSL
jgi:hypothetical protein